MRIVDEKHLYTITEASHWATELFGKNVSPSNISYLIQYGRIERIQDNGMTLVSRDELAEYYESLSQRETEWKERLGADLNTEV